MKWSKIGMVACSILVILSVVQVIQHIGFCYGWEGQFFASDIDAATITCNSLICTLYWLREVFNYAEKSLKGKE